MSHGKATPKWHEGRRGKHATKKWSNMLHCGKFVPKTHNSDRKFVDNLGSLLKSFFTVDKHWARSKRKVVSLIPWKIQRSGQELPATICGEETFIVNFSKPFLGHKSWIRWYCFTTTHKHSNLLSVSETSQTSCWLQEVRTFEIEAKSLCRKLKPGEKITFHIYDIETRIVDTEF